MGHEAGIFETQQELQDDSNSDITVTEEVKDGQSNEEFVTFDQIRRLIGINNGPTTEAQYEDIKDLGHGGVGAILSVRERVLHREIAIKMLRPTYRKRKRSVGRLIREARATAQIEHPNIVPIHTLGVMDDIGVFFTMKKIAGETLQDVLLHLERKDRQYLEKYPPSRLLDIFVNICQAVAFAHSKGIIHRDLKPANIMLGDFGEVLVMDWGLVKFKGEEEESEIFGVYSEDHGDKMLTLDGTITGTPLFMSPEQACGWSDEVDEQSDVYSLGVILYAILTWRQSPFKNSNNIREVLDSVVKADYQPPRKAAKRSIPRELDAICIKAMAKRKCDRYVSVRELLSDIRNYREDYPVTAYRAPLYRRFTRFCGRNRVVAGAIMVALATLFSFMAVKAIYDNLEYRSYQKAAEYNVEFADQARLRAFTLYRQLKRDMTSETEIKAAEREFRRNFSEFENRYNTALLFYSKIEKMYRRDTVVAAGISDVYRKMFEFALATRDFDFAEKLAGMATMRSRNLSYLNDDARSSFLKMREMVSSSGDLKIITNPPGAQLTIWKLADNNRLRDPITPGKTPITVKDIPYGTYLAILKPKDHPSVQYPFFLARADNLILNIAMPNQIPSGMVYVPGGTWTADGKNTIKLKNFFIRRHQITIKEYLDFWQSITNPETQQMYTALDNNGKAIWDEQGNLPENINVLEPVNGISYAAATAYCNWRSKRDGKVYRLPSSGEWERVTNGLPGRLVSPVDKGSKKESVRSKDTKAAPEATSSGPIFAISDWNTGVRELLQPSPGTEPEANQLGSFRYIQEIP